MNYADSSFFVALRVPLDTFHELAIRFYEERQEEVWLWSPWQRIEIFNTVRALARHPDKKRRLEIAEAKALIRRLEQDVRLGYFTHLEADWRDVLRTANELSIEHAFEIPCRAPDLLHVAYAKELAAEIMVSFDDDQLALANAVGLRSWKPA
jgi:predicted nucleic acid-binding protein